MNKNANKLKLGWHVVASAETSPQQYTIYHGDGHSLSYEQANFVAAAANERAALLKEPK